VAPAAGERERGEGLAGGGGKGRRSASHGGDGDCREEKGKTPKAEIPCWTVLENPSYSQRGQGYK
jgi:hypothetical protein